MDPTATLAALLRAAQVLHEDLEAGDLSDERVGVDADAVAEALDHLQALDGWLRRGGFLPEPWRGASS